jgi:penicillin amidase
VPGLDGEVTVVRDDYGIPQLYGDSMDDLMRAQGYVHAQERFYEMDIRRHLTAGRLSELFGKTALETDELIRTMGWRRVAERELALVGPDTRAALEAYADGVNAYIADRPPGELGFEYTVLRAGGLDYRALDAGRLTGLAQGHGLGPTRQHDRRDRPRPRPRRPQS